MYAWLVGWLVGCIIKKGKNQELGVAFFLFWVGWLVKLLKRAKIMTLSFLVWGWLICWLYY